MVIKCGGQLHVQYGHLSDASDHEGFGWFTIGIRNNKFVSKIAKHTATQARCAGRDEANIVMMTKVVYFPLQCTGTLCHHDYLEQKKAICMHGSNIYFLWLGATSLC